MEFVRITVSLIAVTQNPVFQAKYYEIIAQTGKCSIFFIIASLHFSDNILACKSCHPLAYKESYALFTSSFG